MSETPKCPYCGDRMEIHVRPHTTEQEFFSAWYQCVTCESASPRIEFIGNTSQTKIEERLQAVSSRRVVPKNRVLTLEEAQKKCQEDRITWYESFRNESHAYPVYVAPIDPSDNLVDIYAFFTDTRKEVDLYGKTWRCWLRKPTETERWETPWES